MREQQSVTAAQTSGLAHLRERPPGVVEEVSLDRPGVVGRLLGRLLGVRGDLGVSPPRRSSDGACYNTIQLSFRLLRIQYGVQ